MARIGLYCATVAVLAFALFALGGCSKNSTQNTPPPAQPQGSGSLVGKSMDAAKSAECRTQLSQLRQGVETFKVTNEANPDSLIALGLGVGEQFFKCPLSGQPYVYDPASGTVRCTYPQHANY